MQFLELCELALFSCLAGPVLCEQDEFAQYEVDSVWLHYLSVLRDIMFVVIV
jgi:hypothetical protein